MILEECPFCGSTDLSARTEISEVTVPYGPAVPYESTSFLCGICHEVALADEDEREAARQEATVQSVRVMLEELKEGGVSTAHFERALRLPQRTAARWKLGNFSAPAIALLRCIRTFPGLLDIADDDFRVPAELELGPTSSGVALYRALGQPPTSTGTASSGHFLLRIVP